MKLCLRRIFIVLGIIIICLGVFAYFTRDFWGQQLRIYVLGSRDVAAEKFGMFLPEDIDAIEVFTLSNEPNPNDTNGFFGDFKEPLGIISHTTLTGTNAVEVAEAWRRLLVGGAFQSMCFGPVYGLQFKRQGKYIFRHLFAGDVLGIPFQFLFLALFIQFRMGLMPKARVDKSCSKYLSVTFRCHWSQKRLSFRRPPQVLPTHNRSCEF